MPVKRYDPPKFKIRFHWDLHTYTDCALCGGKKIKHHWEWHPSKEHFILDKVMDCEDCGYEYSIGAGNIGISWTQHWEITK